MSTFSPPSSSTTAWTRAPRCPTTVPTGSSPTWCAVTITLLRCPGSRAIELISTRPVPISGTSSSKSFLTKFLCERVRRISGPRTVVRTSRRSALTFSPMRKVSSGESSVDGRYASARPTSRTRLRRSTRITTPVRISPSRSAKERITWSRWICTSRAWSVWRACAATIRPMSPFISSVSIRAPTAASGCSACASVRVHSAPGTITSSTTRRARKTRIDPVSGSSRTWISAELWRRLRATAYASSAA